MDRLFTADQRDNLGHVLSYLDDHDLGRATQVCRFARTTVEGLPATPERQEQVLRARRSYYNKQCVKISESEGASFERAVLFMFPVILGLLGVFISLLGTLLPAPGSVYLFRLSMGSIISGSLGVVGLFANCKRLNNKWVQHANEADRLKEELKKIQTAPLRELLKRK